MSAVALTGYLLAVIAAWYENRHIVLSVYERPIWYTRQNQVVLWIARMVAGYGSALTIAFLTSLIISVLLIGTYWLFDWISFRYFVQSEVLRQKTHWLEIVADEAAENAWDTQRLEAEAQQLALKEVLGNVRTGGYGSDSV